MLKASPVITRPAIASVHPQNHFLYERKEKFFIAKKSFQIFPHLIDNNQHNKTLDFFNNIILFFCDDKELLRNGLFYE